MPSLLHNLLRLVSFDHLQDLKSKKFCLVHIFSQRPTNIPHLEDIANYIFFVKELLSIKKNSLQRTKIMCYHEKAKILRLCVRHFSVYF